MNYRNTMSIRNIAFLSMMLAFFCWRCETEKEANELVVPFQESADLEADFKNPPDYARMRVYWWWLEGYMTKEGVLDDLTAMKEAGITGAIVLDGGSSTYYEGELAYHRSVKRTQSGPGYMSDEWRGLFAYACSVADSLDIEISLNMTSGWNDGGPWVTPEYASQKLVWSELLVDGGRALNDHLPLPEGLLTYEGTNEPYFRQVAVLALKLSQESDSLKPLPSFDIKAVHTIKIPYRADGLGYDWNVFLDPLPDELNGYHAKLDDIIDITDKVDENGQIRWEVPEGRYAVLRFGHTGTGIKVSTHSPGAGGLAIDYLNAQAMDLHFNRVVLPVLDDLQRTKSNSLAYLHEGSWELGSANWTPLMESEFETLNGYQIRKYLPVLAGKIIESYDVSDRFLYDFRRTIADLIHKNHYQRLQELAHGKGLKVHPESGGPHSAPIDALRNLGLNDIPMGEFWTIASTHRIEPHRRLYVKQAASAAHIYGKRFVKAEGPTSIGPHWERDPWLLKPSLDRVFCEGMNRLAFHTFTHSPKEAGFPGNEYFAGTHLNQNVTWWDKGKAFFDWIARNSFMLSQGDFVADVLFYYGDNVPSQVPFKHIDPRIGYGYDYDVVNSEVILERTTVKDGKILLPGGMSYHVLVLPKHIAINLEVLRKIEQLVKEGATVIGPRPQTALGLRNLKTAQAEVADIADRLWGRVDEPGVTEHAYGKGNVFWGQDIRSVLQRKGVAPDFEYTTSGERHPGEDLVIDFIHRSGEDLHIYYVASRKEVGDLLTCSFRVAEDLQPELWYPESGRTVPIKTSIYENGRVRLPLYLDPYGSVFVVFRSKSGEDRITNIRKDGKQLFPVAETMVDEPPFYYLDDGSISFNQPGRYELVRNDKKTEINIGLPAAKQLGGRWEVSFDLDWGGPEKAEFEKLISWTEHSNPGIKYYSGTATYKSSFYLEDFETKEYRLHLNLGELYNLSEVKVNGQSAGIWWKKPFTGDITHLVKKGINTLEIDVVNLWPNRIVGDQFLPEQQRFTKTNVVKFTKDSPLLQSGLIGPVTLTFSSD